MRGSKGIFIQGLVGLLAVASCETATAQASITKGTRKLPVLRGLKKDKEPKEKEPKEGKEGKSPKKPPAPPGTTLRAPKNIGKKNLYTEYNYFVEACEEELVADVINGGLIQHRQFTDFVYGYCRESDREGKQCTKDQQELGFDYLPNEVKLLYIKSFCPQDVEGQVECLHGMNERGRTYEQHDELAELCLDLEQSMVKNGLLEEPGTIVLAALCFAS